jgi:hypothetical protein
MLRQLALSIGLVASFNTVPWLSAANAEGIAAAVGARESLRTQSDRPPENHTGQRPRLPHGLRPELSLLHC